jgi:GNAT superfamily N-acetyltransferase
MTVIAKSTFPNTSPARAACLVSPVTPQDVPDLLAMVRALARYEKLEAQCISTEADFQRALFSARPEAEALIARVDGQPAGFALYCHNFSTFLGRQGLWLEDLFVHEDFRGRGIGKKLLTTLARIAKDRQCGRLEWAVLDWNAPAIEFYESLGATIMDDWRIVRATGKTLDDLQAMAMA